MARAAGLNLVGEGHDIITAPFRGVALMSDAALPLLLLLLGMQLAQGVAVEQRGLTTLAVVLRLLISPVLAFGLLEATRAKAGKTFTKAPMARSATPPVQAGRTFLPTSQPVMVFAPINVAEIAREEALAPAQPNTARILSNVMVCWTIRGIFARAILLTFCSLKPGNQAYLFI